MIRIILLTLVFSSAAFPQGSVLLVGGGSENANDWSDIPYRWLVTQSPNRKIIVLDYSTGTTFFTTYFPSLSPCTVTNLSITTAAQANDSATYRTILQHDGIFLRGGDQSQYVTLWKGTLTQKAIKEVFLRGGCVGGSSAGEMSLSDVMFSAGTANPWSLLRSPTSSITLVDDFLSLVPNILAESHTSERGRIGRLPVFLARYKSSSGRGLTGIGVDPNTALAVGPDSTAEVMGGSAVALLRWTPQTNYAIETGKAFSLSNMKFDELIPGYKVNLKTGRIIMPGTAVPFVPRKISSPAGVVILDGSGNMTDWSASIGSLKRLQSLLVSAGDTVGIFASPATQTSALAVSTQLSAWSVGSRLLLIDALQKNDPAFAKNIASCGAYIFAGNKLDSIAGLLDPSTAAGAAFRQKADAGAPVLFLSEDGMAAGEAAIGGLYTSAYSGYYGTLTQLPGLGLLKGMQIMPRFYQNQDNTTAYDYSENRVDGVLWSMAKSQLPYGVLIDAGAHLVIANNTMKVYGVSAASTPVILFDARNATYAGLPTFHRPGKPNAVQTGAIIGAQMHIIRPDDSYQLADVRIDRLSEPRKFFLEQNYPNPFNPVTTIRYSIPQAGTVSLRIYDVLGRKVATLVDQEVAEGTYEARWDASGIASGIYFARLDQVVNGCLKSQMNKLVLAK